MTGDQWLILLCGGMFLTIPVGMLVSDRRSAARRRCPRDVLRMSAAERGDVFVAALASLNEARADQAPHHGGYVWRNGAEMVWECDDDCPHLVHEEDEP